MPRLHIYLKEDEKERLEHEATKLNMSLTEYIRYKLFIQEEKKEEVKEEGLRKITLHYPSKCIKCNKSLEIGAKAFYDYVNRKALCLSCFYEANKANIKRLTDICIALASENNKLVCYKHAPRGIEIKGVHVCEACQEIQTVAKTIKKREKSGWSPPVKIKASCGNLTNINTVQRIDGSKIELILCPELSEWINKEECARCPLKHRT